MPKYRPSSGTEGMLFFNYWCDKCRRESINKPCPILTDSMIYNINEPEYPQALQIQNGKPVCTAFEEEGA